MKVTKAILKIALADPRVSPLGIKILVWAYLMDCSINDIESGDVRCSEQDLDENKTVLEYYHYADLSE